MSHTELILAHMTKGVRTIRTLALDTGLPETEVENALEWLIAAGLVEVNEPGLMDSGFAFYRRVIVKEIED